jgi:hypothetical protein
MGFKLTTLVVIGTDCTGSCKSNYHTIATTTASLQEREITCFIIVDFVFNERLMLCSIISVVSFIGG